jgi:hypothetical protein
MEHSNLSEILSGGREIELFGLADFQSDRSPGVFTPGQVLLAIDVRFLDARKCRRWVLEQLHKGGPACPICHQSAFNADNRNRFWSGLRLKCPSCGAWFSATSKTFVDGFSVSKKSEETDPNEKFAHIFLMALLLAAGVSNDKIAAALQCTPEKIRLWRNKFKYVNELSWVNSDDESV